MILKKKNQYLNNINIGFTLTGKQFCLFVQIDYLFYKNEYCCNSRKQKLLLSLRQKK